MKLSFIATNLIPLKPISKLLSI